jgi:soluble lytic murein transglycosylase-like protein
MNVLAAQLYAESGFNPFARSPAGAEGIAEFMPGTADAYGLANPFDPMEAIDAQAHLMSDLLKQFDGKVALALAGYNAGAGAVERYGGIPPYAETRAYVTKILGLLGGAGELPIVGGFEVRLVE